ncbi:hypothetical protein CYY_000767 [Polysphondylium violaceum]|uniref:TLDc domain-containing protein n=1 Tax=Polysphondylium violaceum TaxID=133409 RepID=A0A8J4Q475_9MYCE|nr:hypothetical protein CYY_000767 [Polysphondylium violaceum]
MDSILKEEDIAKLQLENWAYRQTGCSNIQHISLILQLKESQKTIDQLKIENTNSINDVKQECNIKIQNITDQFNNKIDQILLSLNILAQENQNLKSNLEKKHFDQIKEHQALKSYVEKNTSDIIENNQSICSQKFYNDSLQKKIQSLQDKQTNLNQYYKSLKNNIEKDQKVNGKEKEVFDDKLKYVTNDLESFKIKLEQVNKEINDFGSRYESEYKALNYKTIQSKIIDYKFFTTINDWIDHSKIHKFTLLYRASENDFNAVMFHTKCDYKGPTITIIETTDGYVFGGYNSQDWKSKNTYYGDNKCFIFTLRNRHDFKPTKYITTMDNCIGDYSSLGPIFTDINIYGKENSYQDFPLKFNDTTFKGKSTLTPFKDFIIKEYEVYQCRE